jgi:hypothetical protein
MAGRRFDLKALKMLRLVQISALFPLILIGSLMLYFGQVSPFGIVTFFLILIVGVIIPETRRDIILSHLLLLRELEERIDGMKTELKKSTHPESCTPRD